MEGQAAGGQQRLTGLAPAHLHRTAFRTTGRQGSGSDQGKAEHSDGLERAEDWHQMSS
jgi:hypothetical protein